MAHYSSHRFLLTTLLPPIAVIGSLVLLARMAGTFPGDSEGIAFAQSLHNSETTWFMESLAYIGQWQVLFAMSAVGALVLFLRNRQECYVLAASAGVMSLGPLVKLLADRPRPPSELAGLVEQAGGNGFPSGHTYMTVVFFGTLIYLATLLIPNLWLRRAVQLSFASIIATMGASRVYLGAHWPSDVIAAYLIGGFVVLAFIRIYHSVTFGRTTVAAAL